MSKSKFFLIRNNTDYFIALLLQENSTSDLPTIQKFVGLIINQFYFDYWKENEFDRQMIRVFNEFYSSSNPIKNNIKLQEKYIDIVTHDNDALRSDGSSQECQKDGNIKDVTKFIVSITRQTNTHAQNVSKSELVNKNLIDDINKILAMPTYASAMNAAILALQPFVYQKNPDCDCGKCNRCREQKFDTNEPYYRTLMAKLQQLCDRVAYLENIKIGPQGERGPTGHDGRDGVENVDPPLRYDKSNVKISLPFDNTGNVFFEATAAGLKATAAGGSYVRFDNNTIIQNEKNEWMVSDKKQDKLISGQNVKKINNQDILGPGNINVSSSLDNVLETYRTDGGDFFVRLKNRPDTWNQVVEQTLITLEKLLSYFRDSHFKILSNTNENILLATPDYAQPLIYNNGQIDKNMFTTLMNSETSQSTFVAEDGSPFFELDHKNKIVKYNNREIGGGGWTLIDTSDFKPNSQDYRIPNFDMNKDYKIGMAFQFGNSIFEYNGTMKLGGYGYYIDKSLDFNIRGECQINGNLRAFSNGSKLNMAKIWVWVKN